MAIITTTKIRDYSDLDLNFVVHPVRKDINKNTGASAVMGSVKNLLLTGHYEKPFHPEIGSNIRKMLFEPMDAIVATNLETEILQTLNNFEPRVRVSNIVVSPDYDNNGFVVNLQFFILNRTEPLTLNFFLSRVR
jgi:phage baseplate assembly protein W